MNTQTKKKLPSLPEIDQRTKVEFEKKYDKPISNAEYFEMKHNLTSFFSLLREWDLKK